MLLYNGSTNESINSEELERLLSDVRHILEANNVNGNISIDKYRNPEVFEKVNTDIDMVRRTCSKNSDDFVIYFSGEATTEYILILTGKETKYLLFDDYIVKFEGNDVIGYELHYFNSSLTENEVEQIDSLVDDILNDIDNLEPLLKILNKIEYKKGE